ncbi:MAG: Cu(I)-responsive transcriptional regulator [Rhodobacteraceae bacterium]|nr:Cu(I)-responsive transcriptional regulator [Paracoccaceae bacterium]
MSHSIGATAAHTGLPAKTIRYYEEIGLVTPLRSENGYRVFLDSDLHKLTFLSRARALGFSIEDCRTLLALYGDRSRASADVKSVAEKHLNAINAKITDLQAMHVTLTQLVSACAGDGRPDCPILEGLSGQNRSKSDAL